MGRKAIDFTGVKIGRLEVLYRVDDYISPKTNKHLPRWKCKCDCGNITVVTSSSLASGRTVSCGCYNSEKRLERNATHGHSNCKLYGVWNSMKARCYNKNNHAYNCYGGRGIKVCDEWINSFESFFNWSTANGYEDNLTLDRIDVNGDYSPDNCRYVTYLTQANNTRQNLLIEYNGIRKTLSDWCRECGIKCSTASARLKRGWDFYRMITTQVNNEESRDMDNAQISKFISRFYGDSKTAFTSGACYWFAYILFGRFIREGATIMYDEVANHFGTRIFGKVYDITGDVTDKYHWVPWDSITDESHRERIVKDCIKF